MRKTLSILLSVVMVLSVLAMGVVGAGAVEGTAINTAEEFLAMAADGTYYLAADITVSETYVGKDAEGNAVAFTGTLDGNGHTVTVSAPLFKQMNGTVKNLTTAGEITIESSAKVQVGAVAASSKGATFENVTNKANITVTTTDATLEFDVGGIAGRLNGHGDMPHAAEFKGCVNEGNVTAHGKAGGIVGGSYDGGATLTDCENHGNITNPSGIKNGFAGGGIVGYNGSGAIVVTNCYNTGAIVSALHAAGIIGDSRKSATVTNCTNKGDISLSSVAKSDYDAAAGGIVGFGLDTSCTVPLTTTGCVNEGKVTAYIPGSADGRAGGIIGYTQKCAKVEVRIVNCVNNGAITGGAQAGGLIAYAYGSGSTFVYIDGCINNGDISGAQFNSHFVAYTNQNATVIKNSVGSGKLTKIDEGKDAVNVIVGLSSGDITQYTIENIFLADEGTTELLSWATKDDNAANRISLNDTTVLGRDLTGAVIDDRTIEASNIKAITRGEMGADLIAAANTAVGSELFALDNGVAASKTEIGSTLVPAPVAPVDPVDPAPVPTGDAIVSVVAVAAVSLVAVLGIAYTSKKEND